MVWMKKKFKSAVVIFLLITFFLPFLFVKDVSANTSGKKDYGVFIGLDSSGLEKMAHYKTLVIDAQYFSKREIKYLKDSGCTVYTYLNIGSVEKFRGYYKKYSKWAMGEYENWADEKWMDVSKTGWQKHLASLEKNIIRKGIDGFFIDNCDVYYEYPKAKIFKGLTKILKHLMKLGKPVIINGGDTYVMKYLDRYGSLSDIMTGVNQEGVWSKINFDTGKFSVQNKNTRRYFQKYVKTCYREGVEVYLLEYTGSRSLVNKIKKYCRRNHFHYYVSKSLQLN